MLLKVIKRTDIEIGERFRKEYGDVESLAKSIKERGLIQPIAVVEKDDGKYTLLAGGRRMEACRLNCMEEIPARVYPSSINELERRSIELTENLSRKDMTWQEQVTLERRIHELQVEIYGPKVSTASDAPGWSAHDTASTLGISAANLSRDMALAKAIESMPGMFTGVKDKATAAKIIKKAGKIVITEQRAESYKEKVNSVDFKKEMMNNFIVGDFFDKIASVPDRYADIIELDPPYAIDLTNQKSSYQNAYGGYNEIASDKYPEFLSRALKECDRVLKSGGFIIQWFGLENWYPIVLDTLSMPGYYVCPQPAVWIKPNGQTLQPTMRLASCYETFLYARKSLEENRQPLAGEIKKPGRGNVFNFQPVAPDVKVHPTERPIELIKDILETFALPDSIVFIPFLGSGNSIIAAHQAKMKGFGFELNAQCKDSFIIKVHKL